MIYDLYTFNILHLSIYFTVKLHSISWFHLSFNERMKAKGWCWIPLYLFQFLGGWQIRCDMFVKWTIKMYCNILSARDQNLIERIEARKHVIVVTQLK